MAIELPNGTYTRTLAVEHQIRARLDEMRAGTRAVDQPPVCLLIDEPELHLHPEAQSALTDFFIAMVNSVDGPRFLLETHSSSMIYRLSRRIAETQAAMLTEAPQLKLTVERLEVYFAERHDGISRLSEVQFDAQGNYLDEDAEFQYFFGNDLEQLVLMREAQLAAGAPTNADQAKGEI